MSNPLIGMIVAVTVDFFPEPAPGAARTPSPGPIAPGAIGQSANEFNSFALGHIHGIVAFDGSEQRAVILGLEAPEDRFAGRVAAILRRPAGSLFVVCPEGRSFTRGELERLLGPCCGEGGAELIT